ncbi:MAG: MarR family transcriptional regulator [Elusimicrobia bacterium]|nr:MarR family transcriptional regulator [Elusimicrobiota bacterium]
MKVMNIGIKKIQTSLDDFESAFTSAENRLPFRKKTGTYFTSLESVRNFLTPKRLEILRDIKANNPHSIYELAKSLRRNFPSVLRDIEILSKHGLVKLSKSQGSRRNSVHPLVDYNAIHLWIGI